MGKNCFLITQFFQGQENADKTKVCTTSKPKKLLYWYFCNSVYAFYEILLTVVLQVSKIFTFMKKRMKMFVNTSKTS